MLHNQLLAEFLEQFGVPLDDRLLLVTAISLHIIVLFLKSFEDVFEFVLICQYHDDCFQEATINILHELFASFVIDLPRMLQSQDGRNDVWELVFVHFLEEKAHIGV